MTPVTYSSSVSLTATSDTKCHVARKLPLAVPVSLEISIERRHVHNIPYGLPVAEIWASGQAGMARLG